MDTDKHRWDLPKQTVLTTPDAKQVGDCWRCCVAAVIGYPAEEVPHFVELARAGDGLEDVLTQDWLNERGFCLVQASQFIFFHRHAKSFDGLPVIACGPTERSRGMGRHHAIVMLGNELLYDPHPSGAGLTAITEQFIIVKLETFPLRPAQKDLPALEEVQGFYSQYSVCQCGHSKSLHDCGRGRCDCIPQGELRCGCREFKPA